MGGAMTHSPFTPGTVIHTRPDGTKFIYGKGIIIMSRSNIANQGVMHLSVKPGGRPICKNRHAIMCVAVPQRDKWPNICKRCDALRRLRMLADVG